MTNKHEDHESANLDPWGDAQQEVTDAKNAHANKASQADNGSHAHKHDDASHGETHGDAHDEGSSDADDENLWGAHDEEEVPEEKKKSKLKTYLILGGVATAFAGLVGGTLLVKSNMNAAPANSESAAIQSAVVAKTAPTPVRTGAGNITPNTTQSTTPTTTPTTAQGVLPNAGVPSKPAQPTQAPARASEPAGTLGAAVPREAPNLAATTPVADEPTPEALEQQARERKAAAGREPVTRDEYFAFVKKVEALSSVYLQTQSETKKKFEAQEQGFADLRTQLQTHQDEQDKKHDKLDEDLRALRDQLSEMQTAIDALNAKVFPKKASTGQTKPTTSTAPAASAQAPARTSAAQSSAMQEKVSVAPPAPEPKREAKPAPTPAPKPPAIAGFSVVATYPAVGGDVKSQRAWITNGQKLIEISVGSKVGEAVITGINGTTVVTTQGSIIPKQ